MKEKKVNGAQAIIDCLEQQGVEHVFGYPGGATIPLFDALLDSSIKLIRPRHEQGATHMGDGYARSTGRAGVVLVTSGPGATNTVTGIMTAHMDSSPLVVITGQTATGVLGLDAFQEVDVSGITYPVVKHSYLLRDPKDIPRVIREAFYLAESGRPGPVLIDVPKNVTTAEFYPDYDAEMELPGYQVPQSCDSDSLAQCAELLQKAKQPLLLVGHGAVIANAGRAIRVLAEKMQIPVLNTLLGKGAFSEMHELNFGMPGMHGMAYANFAVDHCDLIMAIGSRWDDRITANPKEFCPQAVKIHLDIDSAEFNKLVRPDCCLHGDARIILEKLNTLVEPGDTADWLKQLKKWKTQHPLKFNKKGGLRAQQVVAELDDLSQGEFIVATDVGQHQMWAAQYIRTVNRFHWLSSGGAGTMGFGLPSALGAQVANPDKRVVAVVGDGGFQMTCSELATAVANRLPVTVIILNNGFLGMVRQWQDMFYDKRYSGVSMEGNPDFVKLAQAFGCRGFRVRRSADVRKVLTEAIEDTDHTCVVDVWINPEDNVYPMIPAGADYKGMLLAK